MVVSGLAKVIKGSDEFLLQESQFTHITLCEAHHLENVGPEDLVLIEVQFGSYSGKDDIERLSDNYGRKQ